MKGHVPEPAVVKPISLVTSAHRRNSGARLPAVERDPFAHPHQIFTTDNPCRPASRFDAAEEPRLNAPPMIGLMKITADAGIAGLAFDQAATPSRAAIVHDVIVSTRVADIRQHRQGQCLLTRKQGWTHSNCVRVLNSATGKKSCH